MKIYKRVMDGVAAVKTDFSSGICPDFSAHGRQRVFT